MSEKVFEQACKIEFLLIGRQNAEEGFLQKTENPLVSEKIANQEACKKNKKASYQSGF